MLIHAHCSSYGYSPFPLSQYLEWAAELFKQDPSKAKKPIILSITGPADVIQSTIVYLREWVGKYVGDDSSVLGVELNLSCPNVSTCQIESRYTLRQADYTLNIRSEGMTLPVAMTGLASPYTSKQFVLPI
jgi:hypothetical protein